MRTTQPRRVDAGDVLLVAGRPSWFGDHAGYEQVSRHVSSRCVARWLPPQEALRPVRRWRTAAAIRRRALDPVWGHVELEALSAARSGVRLVHFLYADLVSTSTLLAMRDRGIATVGTLHTVPEHLARLLRSSSLRDAIRRYDHVLTITASQRETVLELVPDVHVSFIPHGVDTAFFRPATTEPDGLVFLAVGQAYREVELLRAVAVQALEELPAARIVVWLPVSMATGTWPSNVAIHTQPVTDRDLLTLYRSATASLFLVRFASAHNSVVEALACGVPVIATDVASNREYIDERTGWIVEPNVAAVVDAMRGAASGSTDRRRAARRRAEQLAWPAVAPRFDRIYAEVLDASG